MLQGIHQVGGLVQPVAQLHHEGQVTGLFADCFITFRQQLAYPVGHVVEVADQGADLTGRFPRHIPGKVSLRQSCGALADVVQAAEHGEMQQVGQDQEDQDDLGEVQDQQFLFTDPDALGHALHVQDHGQRAQALTEGGLMTGQALAAGLHGIQEANHGTVAAGLVIDERLVVLEPLEQGLITGLTGDSPAELPQHGRPGNKAKLQQFRVLPAQGGEPGVQFRHCRAGSFQVHDIQAQGVHQQHELFARDAVDLPGNAPAQQQVTAAQYQQQQQRHVQQQDRAYLHGSLTGGGDSATPIPAATWRTDGKSLF